MQISEIIKVIETFAPPVYQESYDNSGVQVGSTDRPCTGILLTLDITEQVIEEAIVRNCNLIIAHHPLLFSGLKRITGGNMVERCVIKAVRHDITLFAAHTNLDNMALGVNYKIAEKLGLERSSILSPVSRKLYKLITYVPDAHADLVRDALFAHGAGQIGAYSECSFNAGGIGTFRAGRGSDPFIGAAGGERSVVQELKLEVLVPEHLKYTILTILKQAHPYEEAAYELIALENADQTVGAGMVGYWPEPVGATDALSIIKERLNVTCIRHTVIHKKEIQKVALCGGSGSFLLSQAKAAKADIFITADYKYHQFFEAENDIIIADVGHYESEQFTTEIFNELLNEKFPNFAIYLSRTKTNPINYYF